MPASVSTSIKQRSIVKKLFNSRPVSRSKVLQLRVFNDERTVLQPKSILIAVPKKTGNAPQRNLLRRRIKHILIENPGILGDHYNFAVLQPRPAAVDLAFKELLMEVKQVFLNYESGKN